MLVQRLPISYATFFYRRSEYPNPEGLSRRMERDIETFMSDSLDFFQTFDDEM